MTTTTERKPTIIEACNKYGWEYPVSHADLVRFVARCWAKGIQASAPVGAMWDQYADEALAGREALCCYKDGGKYRRHEHASTAKASSWSLPFFEYREDEPADRYYCGCWGWD